MGEGTEGDDRHDECKEPTRPELSRDEAGGETWRAFFRREVNHESIFSDRKKVERKQKTRKNAGKREGKKEGKKEGRRTDE